MVNSKKTVQAIAEPTSDQVLAEDLFRLRQAYREGKDSGEGIVVDPGTFLKELKAERGSRG